MVYKDKEPENPYLQNDDLWNNWLELGITESTNFNVDFQFVSDNKESANSYIKYMEQSGYQVYAENFKDNWDITVTTPQQTWTLEKLNKCAKELSEIAQSFGCYIDGIGAMM